MATRKSIKNNNNRNDYNTVIEGGKKVLRKCLLSKIFNHVTNNKIYSVAQKYLGNAKLWSWSKF